MKHFYCLISGIMLFAGLLGGVLNFYLTPQDPGDAKKAWFQSLLGGIVASFMVPLFLNMLSSTLTDQIEGSPNSPADPSKLFVFAGFCLIAAVSSKAFISNISDRILSEAKQTKREVKQIRSEVAPIIAKETEAEAPDSEEARLSLRRTSSATLGDNQRKVLSALANGQFALRTRTGVSKDTSIPKTEVNDLLEELAKSGFAKSVTVVSRGEQKIRWYITPQGRSLLN
jgi:di/tricarboxylate transporter